MADSTSALHGHLSRGSFALGDRPEITLSEVAGFSLTQIAAWPDSLHRVGPELARFAGCSAAPQPGRTSDGEKGSLLRVEPLKWWLIDRAGTAGQPSFDGAEAAVLDLSSSRTWIRIAGSKATVLLNHFLPLNLSEAAFPEGSVASSAIHHVGVTLWRDDEGHNLLVPRSFAVSIWEQLAESAAQYGLEIV